MVAILFSHAFSLHVHFLAICSLFGVVDIVILPFIASGSLMLFRVMIGPCNVAAPMPSSVRHSFLGCARRRVAGWHL